MLADPSVVHSLLCGVTFVNVFIKQVANEILAISRHILESVMVEVEFPLDDVTDDLQLISAGEGHFS